jgi:hypothetical protein
MSTGAALNVFLVKQAATAVGRGEVEIMTPRSGTSGFFFMHAWIPVTANPFGKDEEGIGW